MPGPRLSRDRAIPAGQHLVHRHLHRAGADCDLDLGRAVLRAGLGDGHDGRARRRNARQQPLQCAGLIQQRCHHGDGLAPGLGVKHRILIFIESTA